MNTAFENMADEAAHNSTTPQAIALAQIAESLAGINGALWEINSALQSGAPWPVSIKP
jgi:hypothetical protein